MLALTYFSVSKVYAGKETWTCNYIYSYQANVVTQLFVMSY
jgi:hypothetical protein